MPNLSELIRQARRETGTWTDGELAKLLGVSRSTIQRHRHAGGLSGEQHVGILIRAVHPRNPTLAAQLAAAHHKTLDELGLAAPTPPPDPTRAEHWNSVVCVAADALDLPPAAVRPALAAAFAHALELDVTLAGLVKASKSVAAKPRSKS